MKRLFLYKLLTCLLFFTTLLKAQDGDFFLTHYTPGEGSADNVNFDIVQNHRGIIYIANRRGILTFDGRDWDFTKTPSAIFSLAIDDDNTLFAGGRSGFGKISRDSRFNLKYISLSDTEHDVSDIFNILIHDKKLYAINRNHIFIYNINNGSISKITPRYSGEILNLVRFVNDVYVVTANSGLQLIEGTKLMSPRHEAIRDLDPLFISKGPKDSSYLIGTNNNELYLFAENKLSPLTINSGREYITESGLQNGIWFSDTLAALSTLKGGVVFINPLQGKIEEIINYQTGLPDNEIFAIAIDRNFGVWAAHSAGLTRISPTFPFRNFNRYPGLEGKMLSAKNHQGKLYVGTSLGAYYLEEVRDYNEIVKYIRIEQPVKNEPSAQEEQVEEAEPEKERGGGIFAFLKRGKRKEDKKNDVSDVGNAEQVENPAPTRTVYKTEIERELQSIKYTYKKVEGIDSKTFQFVSVGSRLFCGGLDGLFEINGGSSRAITRLPVRYFYISKNQKKIFVSTYTDELKVFDYTREFKEIDIFGDYKDYVQYIFEDEQQRIWFCSINDLYWVKLRDSEIVEMDEYQMENPYYYETYGISRNDSILFINESGLYAIDEEAKKLVALKNKAIIDRYLPDNNGRIWIHADQRWATLVPHEISSKLDLLSLFKNINYISSDDNDQDYWVITDSNDLYRLSLTATNMLSNSYALYLKDIRIQSEVIPPAPKLRFEQQNSNLIFEFVQPEYSGVLDIQYQYKLDGLNDTWSEWSSSYNVINFPYLPEGEYTLLVKSKNALGKISEASPVVFEVIPPYWKRPWFYALEFSSLALLLFISVKLKKLGYKYRLLSRLLALLTLIIIIEFIQTLAEGNFSTMSSPVLDFIVQVLVAFIILPVEGTIRKYILKEKEVDLRDFIRIREKPINPKINE
ncbi:hypothetical protein C900_01522 [Fulvivirga imtechensis AK7]|uniref:Two component regulator three Y domain-containing protein n=1 Tax=Fulvivirga imtechensis AK7 TaxID=1237149 RepID=L8JXS9_9BACT|nr:triple tyrosine motif-containing protein [Fulvivirga imtechensis]ELR72439.1 hypothetical protein C900_01522 [Fulvivirga imtechensis AK7]